MIDQLLFFGDSALLGDATAFANLLSTRVAAMKDLSALGAGMANIRSQVENVPSINYRTDRVLAVLAAKGVEEDLQNALRLIDRKTSFNNVIIASNIPGDLQFNAALLAATSNISRLVIAEDYSVTSWLTALSAFDVTHPGWDV